MGKNKTRKPTVLDVQEMEYPKFGGGYHMIKKRSTAVICSLQSA